MERIIAEEGPIATVDQNGQRQESRPLERGDNLVCASQASCVPINRENFSSLKAGLIASYQAAFRCEPWFEEYSDGEVESTLKQGIDLSSSWVRAAFDGDQNLIGGTLAFPLRDKSEVLKVFPHLNATAMYLADLWLAPERQRRGYGRQLLLDAEGQMRAAGWQDVVLQTLEDCAWLRGFYEGHGYRYVNTRPSTLKRLQDGQRTEVPGPRAVYVKSLVDNLAPTARELGG
jgi:ribosomal protein S18 acetylase RimI-like enzyme